MCLTLDIISVARLRAAMVGLTYTLLASCAVVNPEPMIDARIGSEDKVVIEDTPRMWAYWTSDVDRAIERELAGEEPGGGIESWSRQWARVIEENSRRENADKYIHYIIISRQKAGLPELQNR